MAAVDMSRWAASSAALTGSEASPSRRLDLLVVDGVRLYRDLLRAALTGRPDVGQVRTAHDLRSTAAALGAGTPDLVLVDVHEEDSCELLHAVRAAAPSAGIIVLGISDAEDEVLACAEAGVHGYLLRTEPLDHLVRLMSAVAAGGTLCTPRISALLLRRVEVLAAESRPAPKVPVLTPREDQVLELLDLGLSNQDIADHLGIEVRTVKNHVHHLLEKVGAHRRGEAVAAFRRLRGGSPAEPRRARSPHPRDTDP